MNQRAKREFLIFVEMNLFRKYISISLLALFLFPLIEKEIHTLEHVDSFHCKASDKHFHELEHTCSICDFIVPVTIVPSEPGYDFSIFVSSSLLFFFDKTEIISAPEYFVSLRGPPVVS